MVVTDAKGRFSVRLPRGVTREVRLSYGDSVQTVKVIVAAPVRLTTDRKTTRNGRTIKFKGIVPGAGPARTRVELQAWASGKSIPFKTVGLKNGKFGAELSLHADVRGDSLSVPGRHPRGPELPVRARPVSGGEGTRAP